MPRWQSGYCAGLENQCPHGLRSSNLLLGVLVISGLMEKILKRLCPYCGGEILVSDIIAGSISGYKCLKCGRSFPSGIEIFSESKTPQKHSNKS